MRQIVLDTETTGLRTEDGHRIIEIGCLELVNRKLTGNRFHQYINPVREVEEGAAAVHGLTNQFLADKPVFSEIAQEFLDFITGAELIIHNAPFDVGFINYEFQLLQKNLKPVAEYCRIFDTLILAREKHVGQRNSLDALCKRYDVDSSERKYHGALLDAHLLAQVFLAMTGGQGSLFDDMRPVDEMIRDKDAKKKSAFKRPEKLTVIYASQEELTLHDEFMQRFKKSS